VRENTEGEYAGGGSLGMAPSANMHLDGRFPSMFEPIHSSALDIVGQGIANPVGPILSAAMMLDELGVPTIAERIRAAVANASAAGISTCDVGGSATSAEVTDAIIANLGTPA
jgi:tartrate dehydrogenase/decarboxylase / D-malate dehydrogenase